VNLYGARLRLATPSMSPSKPAGPGTTTDREVRALLERHKCPTPYPVVRALMLGSISSPRLDVSPLVTLAQIWGGELPEFASQEEVEEVTRVLVHGLWNQLADHQRSRNPFRLARFEVTPTRVALHDLALLRAQEVEGFVDGLFGSEDEMVLPQKAHEAVQLLAELCSMFDGAAELLADEDQPAPAHELKSLLRNLQQLTLVADESINKAVQSCKRARGQQLEAMASAPSRRISGSGRPGARAPHGADGDVDREPEFITSPLSQKVTRNGVSVGIEIYGDSRGRWILEVVDSENGSHVWDDRFETDQEALSEALRALDEETLEFWRDAPDRPPS